MDFKYKFKAEFENGEVYLQNEKDISLLDPIRSCFYDVLKNPNKVSRFSLLFGDEEISSVDLKTGIFSIKGFPFITEQLPISDPELRLVYFRRVNQHSTFKIVDGKYGDEIKRDADITYVIGWQTTIEGKNYEQVIGIQ